MQDSIEPAQAAFARGDHARVIALLRTHVAQLPASALALLGNSALARDDDATALDAFTRLHRKQPQLAPVRRALASLHNRRGSALRRARNDGDARRAFETALQLQPTHREAGYNLALVLDALGQRATAIAQLDAHLTAHPDDTEATWLLIEWQAKDAPETAASRIATMAASDNAPWLPTDIAQLTRIAFALRNAGERAAARVLSERAYQLCGYGRESPGLRHALAGRLAQPPVMDSREAIATERAAFAAEVARLDAEWTTDHLASCEPKLEQLAWSNFYIAYHGENDRELQRAYGELISRATSIFAPTLAARPSATGKTGRFRIGLLSSSFRDCTAGAYFGGWVDWLRDPGHETFVYQLGPLRDAVTDGFAQRATRFHFHDDSLDALAHRVRDDALDLLVYPELGMDARLLPLASLRLAPRQAMGWGHPMTSGLASIDAYFTCGEMEPHDAAAHYTERLLPLPGLGVAYARPPAPSPATRAQLGLPDAVPLVLFPQSLFKIHPDNDAVLDDLARRVPDVRFALFLGEHPRWHARFLARLPARVAERIHWLPLGDRARYLQINRACDLMLDTLHWSGGNTSLDAFASGLPVLTCPGATMRARQSHAMLRAMGLDRELSATFAAELAPRAAALLHDPQARRALAARIDAALPALFDPAPARAAFLRHVNILCTEP